MKTNEKIILHELDCMSAEPEMIFMTCASGFLSGVHIFTDNISAKRKQLRDKTRLNHDVPMDYL